MQTNSLWLGKMRQPVKMLAIASGCITGVIYLYLLSTHLWAEEGMGLYEMIRPEGRPIVPVTWVSVAFTLIMTSLYFSDTKGAIEPVPDGFFDKLTLVTSRLTMIAIAVIVMVMFYEVVARYVFSAPTLWANEMSLWIAAFVFLFAGQYAMQQRSHIRIYVIYDMMPRWAQKTADVISVVLIVFFAFALVWGGYNDAAARWARMEVFGTFWDPPIPGTLKASLLAIISLVAVQAVSNLFSDWNKAPEHLAHDDIDETEIENIRKTLEQ
ncbi:MULTISPECIES: TRAP transporter small permease subunit [unclassified Roseobacter]|jgi:TRAP-type C4-dicarboxylate transport system permease small subunit|uniref:TRAP transporter small permease subunit n=1 Tax=unclassified Roseobacter TaxID=196798 RepID=UPI001E0A13C1|nr:TRAP transporter small permease subunit [Rhodobacterales bacterium HKCCA1058]MBF9024574.1 TRAP transporter small permease subunit [Rhodobacterales bacterium HKCCD6035]